MPRSSRGKAAGVLGWAISAALKAYDETVLRLQNRSPPLWSVFSLAPTILTSSQAILIVWSKRVGQYVYSITTANFLVGTLKCALSLGALARIWNSEGVTDGNKFLIISTIFLLHQFIFLFLFQ